jgi:hypothetical protein
VFEVLIKSFFIIKQKDRSSAHVWDQQSEFNLLPNKLGAIHKIVRVMKELTISKALLMAALSIRVN